MIDLSQKIMHHKGFSMVEFVVVLVIFSIMSGITLFNYNEYRSRIEQTNVTQDIALTIRQAQVYGLSGSDRQVGDAYTDPGDIFGAQVLDITQDRSIRGLALLPSQQRIIIFEDINRNRQYDPNDDRMIDERTIISSRIHFDVCLVQGVLQNGWDDCSEIVPAGEGEDYISITFERPYPDTTIRYNGSESYSHVLIGVQGPYTNIQRYVEVTPIGRISVKG